MKRKAGPGEGGTPRSTAGSTAQSRAAEEEDEEQREEAATPQTADADTRPAQRVRLEAAAASEIGRSSTPRATEAVSPALSNVPTPGAEDVGSPAVTGPATGRTRSSRGGSVISAASPGRIAGSRRGSGSGSGGGTHTRRGSVGSARGRSGATGGTAPNAPSPLAASETASPAPAFAEIARSPLVRNTAVLSPRDRPTAASALGQGEPYQAPSHLRAPVSQPYGRASPAPSDARALDPQLRSHAQQRPPAASPAAASPPQAGSPPIASPAQSSAPGWSHYHAAGHQQYSQQPAFSFSADPRAAQPGPEILPLGADPGGSTSRGHGRRAAQPAAPAPAPAPTPREVVEVMDSDSPQAEFGEAEVMETAGGKKKRGKKASAPRTSRACLQCRKQKMRCIGAEDPPCKRCRDQGFECLFERRSDYILNPEDVAWQRRVDQQIESLRVSINSIISCLHSNGLRNVPAHVGDLSQRLNTLAASTSDSTPHGEEADYEEMEPTRIVDPSEIPASYARQPLQPTQSAPSLAGGPSGSRVRAYPAAAPPSRAPPQAHAPPYAGNGRRTSAQRGPILLEGPGSAASPPMYAQPPPQTHDARTPQAAGVGQQQPQVLRQQPVTPSASAPEFRARAIRVQPVTVSRTAPADFPSNYVVDNAPVGQSHEGDAAIPRVIGLKRDDARELARLTAHRTGRLPPPGDPSQPRIPPPQAHPYPPGSAPPPHPPPQPHPPPVGPSVPPVQLASQDAAFISMDTVHSLICGEHPNLTYWDDQISKLKQRIARRKQKSISLVEKDDLAAWMEDEWAEQLLSDAPAMFAPWLEVFPTAFCGEWSRAKDGRMDLDLCHPLLLDALLCLVAQRHRNERVARLFPQLYWSLTRRARLLKADWPPGDLPGSSYGEAFDILVALCIGTIFLSCPDDPEYFLKPARIVSMLERPSRLSAAVQEAVRGVYHFEGRRPEPTTVHWWRMWLWLLVVALVCPTKTSLPPSIFKRPEFQQRRLLLDVRREHREPSDTPLLALLDLLLTWDFVKNEWETKGMSPQRNKDFWARDRECSAQLAAWTASHVKRLAAFEGRYSPSRVARAVIANVSLAHTALQSLLSMMIALRVPMHRGEQLSDELYTAAAKSIIEAPTQIEALTISDHLIHALKNAPVLLQRVYLIPVIVSLKGLRSGDFNMLSFEVKSSMIVDVIEVFVEKLRAASLVEHQNPFSCTGDVVHALLTATLNARGREDRTIDQRSPRTTELPMGSPTAVQRAPDRQGLPAGPSQALSKGVRTGYGMSATSLGSQTVASGHGSAQGHTPRDTAQSPPPTDLPTTRAREHHQANLPAHYPVGTNPRPVVTSAASPILTPAPAVPHEGASSAPTPSHDTGATAISTEPIPSARVGQISAAATPLDASAAQSAVDDDPRVTAEQDFNDDEVIFDMSIGRHRSASVASIEDLQDILSNPDYD